jgi:hypothetical protein
MNNDKLRQSIMSLVKFANPDADIKEEDLSDEILASKFFSAAPEDSWDDAKLMFEDIREHAKNNGRAVIEEDRPINLRLAWRCQNTEKTWSIRITNFKASFENVSEHKDIMRRALMTQEGKHNLTAMLNDKK